MGIGAFTSGCTDRLGLSDAQAAYVYVASDTIENSDYMLTDEQSIEFTEQIQVGDQTEEINIENKLAVYQRDDSVASIGRSGAFHIFTTPKITAAGDTDLNPVASLEPANLPLDRFTPSAGAIKNIEQTGTETGAVGQTETDVTTFSAEIQPEDTNESLPIILEISAPVRAGNNDSVITFAAYPKGNADREAESQGRLRSNIEL